MLVQRGEHWDETADVVVIGFGCAGAVAAATAHDNGADVLVLEKQPFDSHHSTSSLSGGLFVCPSDAKVAMEHLKSLYRVGDDLSWTEQEVIRAWAEYAVENKAWVEANGGSVQPAPGRGEHPQVPGHDVLTRYRFRGRGPGMTRFLKGLVQARGIPVMYDTSAKRLLTNGRGRVVGVETENRQEGQVRSIRIRAARGVVLTCGGFEFNETMKLNYLKVYPTYFSGSEANTGDGIKMALKVGADLWHMNCVSARLVGKFPGIPMGIHLNLPGLPSPPSGRENAQRPQARPCGYLIVDRHGRRFTNEDFKAHALYYELALYDTQRLIYPRVPSYWVFDRKRMEAGPIPSLRSGALGPSRLHRWSRENAKELEKGWIRTARTIRDLARMLHMDPDVLEATLKTYNTFCERQKDLDFGRAPATLVPIEEPPYFCVDMWPGGPNTQGGPRRNARAQVLNADGEAISGLYSAGELGSMYGMLYPSAGGNLAECIAFGRIAGSEGCKESPRG